MPIWHDLGKRGFGNSMVSKKRFQRGPLIDFIYKFIERAGIQIVSLIVL